MRTPYTYRISWSNSGESYYGVRYRLGCHPSDLFVKYFTSSRVVHAKIRSDGMPDVIEVRKTFTTVNEARQWEARVLKRLDIRHSSKWLNMFDGEGFSIEAASLAGTNGSAKCKALGIGLFNIENIHKGVAASLKSRKENGTLCKGGHTTGQMLWWVHPMLGSTKSRTQPGPEWIRGRGKLPKLKRGGSWFHNPTTKQRTIAKECPPGFVPGVGATSTGAHWWHNPITGQNTRAVECPVGFIKGRKYLHKTVYNSYRCDIINISVG